MEKCKYPSWAINKDQNKVLNNNQGEHDNSQHSTDNNQKQPDNNQGASTTNTTPRPTNTIGQVVIPYTQGTDKGFKNICSKYGIQVHFKGNTTIKQLLMKPKDQDPKDKKSGVIYSYQCTNIACNEEYIGETARTLGDKMQGTSKASLSHPCTHPTNRRHHRRQ